MKKLFKYTFLILGVFFIQACSNTDLDLLDNPNEVSPENAELNLVYNNVMFNFGRFLDEASDETMPYVRMTAMATGNQYQNQDSPTSFDFMWNLAYADLFPDIDLVIELTSDGTGTVFSGTSKIIKAYVAMTLVDLFGDVPYSEAGKGAEIQNPKRDSGSDVYAEALALIDAGIADLSAPTGVPSFDLFYEGKAEKWIKLANSLKIRYHVTTKLSGGSATEINSIVSAGDYITATEDDFQYNYGTSRNNPDSRHPYYSDGYENGGPSWYMSNYYMWNMFGVKNNEDPRLRYYFYRQDCDETGEDQFTLACPTEPYPFHWANGYPFCTASGDFGDPNGNYGGYWGRDHGNDRGIPPDDLKRTAWGLYPAGGKFDADDCDQVSNMGTDGALGAGIQPVLLSSYVDFLLAEAVLTMGVSGDASEHLRAGLTKSISKVMNFAGGAGDSDLAPTQEDVDAYINEVMGKYSAADDQGKLNIVMTEYWLALHGNGLDAYNNYRRTGMPLNMQPTLEADPGRYARSFWYPADFVNLNSEISEQKDISDKVFWDTNPDGFIN